MAQIERSRIDPWLNKVHQGHSLDLLKKMPSDSVDLVITSSPYWGLRFYGEGTVTSWPDGWKGQLGLEPNYQLFIKHLVSILHEVKRVLKPSGSLYLNLGDTYSASGKGFWRGHEKESKEVYHFEEKPRLEKNLPAKCMMGIPWRVALAMMDKDGWILRNSIIWHKPNHIPSSVRDRLTNGYEFIFHLVKSQKYYYNLDAIREPLANPIPRTPVNYQKRMDARRVMKRYQAKFAGAGGSSEAFGSPRARNERLSILPGRGNDEYVNWYFGKDRQKKSWVSHNNDAEMGYGQQKRLSAKEGFKALTIPHPFGKNPGDVWTIVKDIVQDTLPKIHSKIRMQLPDKAFRNTSRWLPPEGKNPGDFWKIATQPFPEGHFAVFPMAICWKPILSSCPPNGIVLDPFGGSGTVAMATKVLNINNEMPKRDDLAKILSNFKNGVKPLSCAAERNWILLEISKEYCAMAEKRLF